jgi:hypothetical protein
MAGGLEHGETPESYGDQGDLWNPPKEKANWRFKMKMVKSLLLGSAAGLVAVAGAQAADLPVKAKPVEYVKVCSLYGAGFWYVPGTDTCLKIGSYVRVQTEWDANGGGIPIGFGSGNGAGRFDRTDTNELAFRTRASLSIDLRTQTEYGTLRSYIEVGAQATTPNDATEAVFFDRGFIQFAGFTAGRIRSYFDINSFAPYSYSNNRVSGDTGASGIYGMAYTAQFGNGVTASLSLEDGGAGAAGTANGGGRNHMTANLSETTQFALGATSFDNKGWTVPDVVGALRIDQAWGYAQIAAAMHDASGGYYQVGGAALAAGIINNGHPADKYGFAVTGGFTLNDVLGMKGDQVGMQAAYSQGAAGYVTRATGAFQVYGSGNNAGFGWVTDGVFGTIAGVGQPVELTTVWGINGFYQHFWNPKWRTSLYGGYVEVDYDTATKSGICGAAGIGGAVAAPAGISMTAVSNCNPDFSWWQVGTRTQWNPHPDLDIGLDVLWNHLNTAFKGTATLAANGARPAGVYAIDDQDVLSVMFRVQRNFLP